MTPLKKLLVSIRKRLPDFPGLIRGAVRRGSPQITLPYARSTKEKCKEIGGPGKEQ